MSKHLLCAKLKHIPRKVKKINTRRHVKEKVDNKRTFARSSY